MLLLHGCSEQPGRGAGGDASSGLDIPTAVDGPAPGDQGRTRDAMESDSTSGADLSPAADTLPPGVNCVTDVWQNLEVCGWPGPGNTGYPAALTLVPTSGRTITTDNTVIDGERIQGELTIDAKNVTIRNCHLKHDGGGAGGSGVIRILEGASATIEHVEIDGMDHTHACIWHEGASMTARHVNCHGVNDGIFCWAANGATGSGDNFTIEESYFHDLTVNAANGHMDGFQTEGAANGLIKHNTYLMLPSGTSAIAIWNSLKSSDKITVQDNLLTGGGATVYAEDYDPSEADPVGGFSVTNIHFNNNTFSTKNGLTPCVGLYFAWYSRPQYAYGGGPTDGWNRSGNFVLETQEKIDNGNPHDNGQLCQ